MTTVAEQAKAKVALAEQHRDEIINRFRAVKRPLSKREALMFAEAMLEAIRRGMTFDTMAFIELHSAIQRTMSNSDIPFIR